MLRDSADDPLDMLPAEHSGLDDLDWDAIRAYWSLCDGSHATGGIRKMSDTDFLCHMGAAVMDGDGSAGPSRAGLLMFGQEWYIVQDFPGYLLDYRRQVGDNRRWEDRFTSQELEWSDNLFDFYERSYRTLVQTLNVPSRLEEDRLVDETPAHETVREAIVNALSNADYNSSRGVVSRRTAKGLEFTNQGSFCVGVEQAYVDGTSDARNKTVLKMFSLIQVGERAGSDMPNMVDSELTLGVRLGLSAGLRRKEICGFRWRDVDLKGASSTCATR